MAIICIWLSSISTIVFTKSYVSDIEDFCVKKVDNYSYSKNRTNLTLNDEYKYDD